MLLEHLQITHKYVLLLLEEVPHSLQHLGDLRKTHTHTHTLIFGVCILRFLSFSTISGALKPFVAVSQLPAALQLPQKTWPWIFAVGILWILSLFNHFRVQQMLRSVGMTKNRGDLRYAHTLYCSPNSAYTVGVLAVLT